MKAAELVLGDWLSDAQAARRMGHTHDAELIERIINDFQGSDAADWLTWLTHAEAKLRSGESESWFKRNRRRLRDMNHCVMGPKGWLYRQCAVPQRKHDSVIMEDAKRAAQSAA